MHSYRVRGDLWTSERDPWRSVTMERSTDGGIWYVYGRGDSSELGGGPSFTGMIGGPFRTERMAARYEMAVRKGEVPYPFRLETRFGSASGRMATPAQLSGRRAIWYIWVRVGDDSSTPGFAQFRGCDGALKWMKEWANQHLPYQPDFVRGISPHPNMAEVPEGELAPMDTLNLTQVEAKDLFSRPYRESVTPTISDDNGTRVAEPPDDLLWVSRVEYDNMAETYEERIRLLVQRHNAKVERLENKIARMEATIKVKFKTRRKLKRRGPLRGDRSEQEPMLFRLTSMAYKDIIVGTG